jgi:hypothetical protein
MSCRSAIDQTASGRHIGETGSRRIERSFGVIPSIVRRGQGPKESDSERKQPPSSAAGGKCATAADDRSSDPEAPALDGAGHQQPHGDLARLVDGRLSNSHPRDPWTRN